MLKKVLSLLMLIVVVSVTAFAQDYENYEYYDTNSYDVDIKISKDNVYSVTETIQVDFKEQRHGIFRYIPYIQNVKRPVNGEIEEFRSRSRIYDVNVQGYDFDVSSENGNKVIKIGDKDTYVYGKQTYVITYKFKPDDDKVSEYDEIYFNILPYQWETPIDKVTFKVEFPKEIKDIDIYAGLYGENAKDAVNYTLEGKTLKGESTVKYPRYFGITMLSRVEEGYFASQTSYTALFAAMWIFIVGIAVLAIICWFLFGRDEMLVTPVCFMPPYDMSPAELGYIIDDAVDDRDIISLFFYWADKGYITIEEKEKDEFIFTKIKDLPEETPEYQHTVFSRLFRSGTEASTKKLSGKFFETLQTAKTQVKAYFEIVKGSRLYTKTSTILENIFALASFIPVTIALAVCGYANVVGTSSVVTIVFLSIMLFLSFIGISMGIEKYYFNKKSGRATKIFVPCCFSAVILLCMILYANTFMQGSVAGYYINPFIPVTAGAISTAITMIFSCIMRKRTENMNKWFGELIGFKDFIETAEKEKLEMLIAENPNYFYNILPYAYALGVSDVWAKRFEGIAIQNPTWYTGHNMNSFWIYSSMTNSFTNMQTKLSIPPSTQANGKHTGSFGGGGSFGGFSGGGFGGGGGGSW